MTLICVTFTFALTGCVKRVAEPEPFRVEREEPTLRAEPRTETSGVRKPYKIFRIYTDAKSPDNHYVPSGWMGDWGALAFEPAHFDNPHSGSTCIKITYRNVRPQGAGWAGIYWQNPANNWGRVKGGFDHTGAKRLVFWARGEEGGERIEEFRVGGISGEFADSDAAGIGPVILGTEWKEYAIDLEGKDLSSISGGFMWVANLDGNPDGFVMYLDDIRYE